jgi:hypothetical protein
VNTLAAPLGVRLPDRPPLLHYADRQDVIGWLPTAVPRRDFIAPPAA